jgi:hypothetical protein
MDLGPEKWSPFLLLGEFSFVMKKKNEKKRAKSSQFEPSCKNITVIFSPKLEISV